MQTLKEETNQNSMRKQRIIDCDVHVAPRNADEIRKYMDPYSRSRFSLSGRDLYHHPMNVNRTDSVPPRGGGPGSDPDFLREQLINEYGIDYAILLPRPFSNPLPNANYATAVCSAYNEWQADTWLRDYNHDQVFRGSILISTQDPEGSVKQIERWAAHSQFVQVLSDSGSRAPYGQKMYYPIFEACEHYGLPFAIHAGADGIGINIQPTIGYPTHYIEWATLHSISYQSHLVSLLVEGVFERFPKLKVVLVEGGVAWLPTLLWRLDQMYERYSEEVPWLRRKPSEYMRDHIRLTSQPIERPDKDRELVRMLELMDAENILMFASDYPHWDFDSPKYAFPKLPDRMRERIFFENARELYGLK
ncbi:amidohydrolase family protein [Paenibacillus cremeus]|uniref:Amidohydrolase n=1 Tax=Paenibacillus cremeus TaxID=2163881 RepID=A0A559K8C4_9BACL|nr:amidohydrolase family protein [Paenibacillus cremeus]TVY08380.1 amidohydrolase [Paenibacillus cremeus]